MDSQAAADHEAAEREREFAGGLEAPIWCHAVAEVNEFHALTRRIAYITQNVIRALRRGPT